MPHTPKQPRLFGRDVELRRLQNLLEAQALVTVCGPLGVGKSALVHHWADTSWLHVDAAAVSSWSALVHQLAKATTVAYTPSTKTSEEKLAEHWREHGIKPHVWLDNADRWHPELKRWLPHWCATNQMACVVTSRMPLGVDGEGVLALKPLPCPEEGQVLASNPGVRLVLHRAQSMGRSAVVGADDVEHVAELVRRLDGLPLALEAVGACLRLMSAKQLTAQLEHRFDVVAQRPLTISRHASFEAACEEAWALLDDSTRQGLMQLSLCRGGLDMNAAIAVLEGVDPFALLERVVGTWLQWSDVEGVGVRYQWIAPMRQFAFARLKASSNTTLWRRFADHYMGLGQLWTDRAHGAQARQYKRLFVLEEMNFQTLLDAPDYENDDAHSAQDALSGTLFLYSSRYHLAASRPYLNLLIQVLERPGVHQCPPTLQAHALIAAGQAASSCEDRVQAKHFFERAAELAGDDFILKGHALMGLGILHLLVCDFDEAQDMITRAIDVMEQAPPSHNRRLLIAALNNAAGLAAESGDNIQGRALIQRAFKIAHETNSASSVVVTWINLGLIETSEGHLDKAQYAFERALELEKFANRTLKIPSCLAHLSTVSLLRGDLDRAEQQIREGLALAQDLEQLEHTARLLMRLSIVLAERGNVTQARQAQSEATALAQGTSLVKLLHYCQEHLELTQALRDGTALAWKPTPKQTTGISPLDARIAGLILHARQQRIQTHNAFLFKNDALCIQADGSGFCLPGADETWRSLGTRKALCRILAALGEAHRNDSGSLTVDALLNAGWPDEHVTLESGTSRVYVAISTLRKMGLGALLKRNETGYCFDPSTIVRLITSEPDSPKPIYN